jgi:hypothetical protein
MCESPKEFSVIKNGMRVRIAVVAVLMAVAALRLGAQEQLPRISLTDARLKIVRVVQAERVAGVYANSVTADVVIGVDGSVESVTVLEGQEAHRASAIAALRQYQFAPVVIDGKPARVITRLSVHVPDNFSTETLAKAPDGTNSITVPARRDVVLLADCSRALSTQDGSPPAIQTCRDAVAAADQAGAAAFNRRSPRSFLGDVYMFAKRWSDAVAAYQSALSITGPSEASDLNTGEILTKIAIAQVNLGDLLAADRSAESAAAKIQGSMTAHPDQRQEHVTTLRSTFLFHARIKQLRGDAAAATTLERKAAALGSSK